MAKPGKRDEDSRSEYDIDVDRMLNEGLAGGIVRPTYNRVSIEEAHEIRKNNEPFSPANEIRTEE
ncbi:hypothetical protein E3U55_07335 [Filobacillus milosensis]|uniref:Uncharacterized protein n=1 Tax=Filobacillus milosensis TaxID=94137 RepID=A0A4Y8INJ0_9BACI|nr:hypothetical protein [Filobacillus milosensis]TFB22107.1 hypothetical protein E3U55_07335 [Filobacillus milosensis]